jgi:hypothetical protein
MSRCLVHPMKDSSVFFGKGQEDVILAREVGIESRGAVLDAIGDLAQRDLSNTLGDEQFARCGQDGLANSRAMALPTLVRSHKPALQLGAVHLRRDGR